MASLGVGYSVTGGEKARAYLTELALKVATATTVSVGFTADMRYPDGTHLAEAAIINNFGSAISHIPPRPFFSQAVEDGKREWGALFREHFVAAGMDAEKALWAIGRDMARKIAQRLQSTTSPRLSDLTLLLRSRFPDRVGMDDNAVEEAKADLAAGIRPPASVSDKPLEWTGQMLRTLQSDDVIRVTK